MARLNRISICAVVLLFARPEMALSFSNAFSGSGNANAATINAELNAVSIPLLDTHSGDSNCWSRTTRRGRIEQILERARDHQRKREQPSSRNSQELDRRTKQVLAANNDVELETIVPIATAESKTLPFTLPTLSQSQSEALQQGEIIMEQSEMGRQGSGFVVQDIDGVDESAVWEALLDFSGYTNSIHTVRSSRVRGTTTTSGAAVPSAQYGVASTTRASFDISKFRLSISCFFKYNAEKNYMEISLDDAFQNSALQAAKGFWYTQRIERPNGVPSIRVWLLCDLTLSPLLPKFIVDLTAASAMPRASTWLRPAVQAIAADRKA